MDDLSQLAGPDIDPEHRSWHGSFWDEDIHLDAYLMACQLELEVNRNARERLAKWRPKPGKARNSGFYRAPLAEYSAYRTNVTRLQSGISQTAKGVNYLTLKSVNFSAQDLENIRALKQGHVLIETDTDLIRTVAHGSDGSRALIMLRAHFTSNANGETTVQFETDRVFCT